MAQMVVEWKSAHELKNRINPIALWLRALKQELLATFFAHKEPSAKRIQTLA